jgi:hypothetical protein
LHNGSIFLGKFVKGAVGKWTYKVEVSDYRPWFWARWKFQFTAEKAAREED